MPARRLVKTSANDGSSGIDPLLKPAQCTGIVGRNGVGKTTLLRICLGERPTDEGTVKIGKRVLFNYIDQARMQLDGQGTVLQEISDGSESVLFGEQRMSARSYLRRFLFSDERVNEPVSRLLAVSALGDARQSAAAWRQRPGPG